MSSNAQHRQTFKPQADGSDTARARDRRLSKIGILDLPVEERAVGWQTFGTWMEEEEEQEDEAGFVTVEVHSVRRHRVRSTDALKAEFQRLHDLQLNSLRWIANLGNSSLGGTQAGEGLHSLLAMRSEEDVVEVASSFKVVSSGTEVECEMAPLVDVAPWGMQGSQWPPVAESISSSPEQLTEWLKLAAVVQAEEAEEEQEQQDSHFHMAFASLLYGHTVWQQLKNLPTEVIWQLTTGLALLALVLSDTGTLYYAIGEGAKPSAAACGFMATLQLIWCCLGGYYLFKGVWLENAFQMDASVLMIVVLVLVNTDKAMTEISISGQLSSYGEGWYRVHPVACNLTTAANASIASTANGVASDPEQCCDEMSLSISCAALTHMDVVDAGPVNTGMRLFLMVILVFLESRTRRSFGWRAIRTSGYDVALRQQRMR